MSRARPEPAESHPHVGASTLAFPWLLSTTLHTGLFVVLALVFRSPTRTNAPPAAGVSLEVSMLSSDGADDGTLHGTADGSLDGTADSAASIVLDSPPEGGYYEDDEPVLYAEEFGASGSTSGGTSLESMLSEEPAVAVSGVLPAGSVATATGSAESSDLNSGIASATELTGEAAPARRMKGGRALTGVFGLVGEGHKFVYVFDRSGSMDGHGGAPLIAAKSQLLNSLEDLGQTHQFQIIFYNEQPRIFSPTGDLGRLVFGTDQNKNLARRFVGSITASGATRHVEALQMALRLAPDVIFFLTDADEPRMTPSELAKVAQMNRGTTINTIEFGTSPQHDADNFIVRLARQNGGQHVYIDVTRLSSKQR